MGTEIPEQLPLRVTPPVVEPPTAAVAPEASKDGGAVARVVSPPDLRFARTSDVAPAAAQAPSVAARLHGVAAQMGPETLSLLRPFERAGLGAEVAFQIACCGATPAEAKAHLQALLSRRPPQADYGPTMVVADVLGGIAGGQRNASPKEVQAMLRAHERTCVLRPDGYVVSGKTGRPWTRAGPLEKTSRGFGAGGLELGALYHLDSGALHVRAPGGGSVPDSVLALQKELDPLVIGHVLNGFEGAILSVAEGVAQLLTEPVQTLHDLGRLPHTVAEALRASPELFERFAAMPLGAQIEAASELVFTAALAEVGLGAAGRAGSLAKSVGGPLGGELTVQLSGAAAQLGELSWRLEGVGAVATGGVLATGGVVFAKAMGTDRRGPNNTLPEVDPKAQASMKRAAKELEAEEVERLKKALPRIDRARRALMEGIDELLSSREFVERTTDGLKSARNALRDHGSQADLTGALRDRVDLPVRLPGAGRSFDHANECRELIRALDGARGSLVFEIRRSAMRGAAPPPEMQRLLNLLDEVRSGVLSFVDGPNGGA